MRVGSELNGAGLVRLQRLVMRSRGHELRIA
jgi:hypothetical protein